MPTYNRSHCIAKAINSLLCQKSCDYELIIVDDGSTDDTEALIKKEYANEIKKRIIVYKKIEHKGAATARNEGIRLAKGEWVGYLDSDNLMVDNFLELYRSAIEKNSLCKFFYAKMHCIGSGEIIGQEFDEELLKKANFIDIGTVVHHIECVEKCGSFDEKLKRLMDYELILRYTQFYYPVFIDKVVLEYDDSRDSNRITNNEKLDVARRYIAKKYKIDNCSSPDFLCVRGKLLLFMLKFARLLRFLSKDKYSEKRDLLMIKNSSLFDEMWYLKNLENCSIKAAEHYYRYGWKNGFNPSAKFDGNDYLKRYSDVAQKQVNPLLHYLQNGVKEGRIFVSCRDEK